MSDNLVVPERKYDQLDGEIIDTLSAFTKKANAKLEFTRTGVTVENLVLRKLSEIFSISYNNKGRVFFVVGIDDGKIQSYYYDSSAFDDLEPCFKKKHKKEIIEYLNSLVGLELSFHKKK